MNEFISNERIVSLVSTGIATVVVRVSVFLGLLISLVSESAISNLISGIVIT